MRIGAAFLILLLSTAAMGQLPASLDDASNQCSSEPAADQAACMHELFIASSGLFRAWEKCKKEREITLAQCMENAGVAAFEFAQEYSTDRRVQIPFDEDARDLGLAQNSRSTTGQRATRSTNGGASRSTATRSTSSAGSRSSRVTGADQSRAREREQAGYAPAGGVAPPEDSEVEPDYVPLPAPTTGSRSRRASTRSATTSTRSSRARPAGSDNSNAESDYDLAPAPAGEPSEQNLSQSSSRSSTRSSSRGNGSRATRQQTPPDNYADIPPEKEESVYDEISEDRRARAARTRQAESQEAPENQYDDLPAEMVQARSARSTGSSARSSRASSSATRSSSSRANRATSSRSNATPKMPKGAKTDPALAGLGVAMQSNAFVNLPGKTVKRLAAPDGKGGIMRNGSSTRMNPILIGAFEVTWELWDTVMGPSGAGGNGLLPVAGISPTDIEQFLQGLNAGSADYQYRLPTEVEWIAACQETTGNKLQASCLVRHNYDQMGWLPVNSGGVPHVVGELELFYPEDPHIYDIVGNMSEIVVEAANPRQYMRIGASYERDGRDNNDPVTFSEPEAISPVHSARDLGFRLVAVPKSGAGSSTRARSRRTN